MGFAARVAEKAKAHGKEVSFDLRLSYKSSEPQSIDKLKERMHWALGNDDIDAIVFYEKHCFTDYDPEQDCITCDQGDIQELVAINHDEGKTS